jgi:hypothetical protein
VVKENIDDFGMEPEEAVADAIQQFISQGVDLSCIVKSAGPASESPVIKAIEALAAACDAPASDPRARIDALSALCGQLEDRDTRVLAGENEAILLVLRCCGGGGSVASAIEDVSKGIHLLRRRRRAQRAGGVACAGTRIIFKSMEVVFTDINLVEVQALKRSTNCDNIYMTSS